MRRRILLSMLFTTGIVAGLGSTYHRYRYHGGDCRHHHRFHHHQWDHDHHEADHSTAPPKPETK